MNREELKPKISLPPGRANCSVRSVSFSGEDWISSLERLTTEGDSPVSKSSSAGMLAPPRVELFGIAALSGW